METPIYKALTNILSKDASRFHMPGHKGRDYCGLFGGVMQYDITEIQGADSLYEAGEAILRCEELLADYYGAKRSLISCQGSTLCIQTMLSLVRHRGSRLVIGRNAHVAASNAMALLDFEPVWVYPVTDSITGVTGAVTPEQVEVALRSQADVAAVYITSPSYYGVFSDIAAIAAVCSRYNVPLLVDNAHGAHLKAAGYQHPIAQGAAMCCDSAHKTLPVITGGAYLHIAQDEYVEPAKETMAVFGSTSPSYLIMLSLDTCLSYLQDSAKKDFYALRSKIAVLEQLTLQKGFTPIPDQGDHTRMLLCAYHLGYSGEQLAAHLRAFKVEPEYVGENTVVLLPSPLNTEQDFERLTNAINGIEPRDNIPALVPPPIKASVGCHPREAFMARKKIIPVQNSLGRIVAANKSSCPPGVPVVYCGELITKEAVRLLTAYGYETVTVIDNK